MALIALSRPVSCKTSAFTDPGAFGHAVRAVKAEIVVVGKGDFRAELTKIDFERLWMQRGHETLARIVWARNDPARVPIFFLTRMNQVPANDSGMEVSPGDILFANSGASHHARTTGETHWGAMSLSPEDLAAAGRALIGRELSAPTATCRLRPDPELMSRLLHLHGEAGRLAKSAPEILARPEVAHALEQKLLHLMVRCLADGNVFEGSNGNRRRGSTLVRLEALLMANSDRPLYLAEICMAIGVSERALRQCCQEHLGMGPIQYLWLRRMTLAHRALLQATAATTTVTDIATGFGFWELGRFAVAHRTLFGESPSASLARIPVDRPRREDRPFKIVRSPNA